MLGPMHVSLHFAQSLDGKIAQRGSRTLLSTSEGLLAAHQARAAHDAVLVGSGTLRIDDPRLTVRECAGRSPRRVILAGALEVSSTARVFAAGADVMVLGVAGRATREDQARLSALGADVRLLPGDAEGLVDLPHALRTLAEWGVQRLLVEGGGKVITSFLRQRLAQDVTIEIAPCLMGDDGLSAFGCIGAPRLAELRVERAGANVMVRGNLVY
jgi:riboflavin-specific deaminase-like protein